MRWRLGRGPSSRHDQKADAMAQHLILQLEAPLMAFGGTMIDAIGPTLEFPIKSLITGLIANALGWRCAERERHQHLQERIVMGVRLDRPGAELLDYQTALLFENEQGWTTRGIPEGRKKSSSYKRGRSGRNELTHQRYRYYRADARVIVALRLEPSEDPPTLEEVANALDHPARPLFIGRKTCLPSVPLIAGPPVEAESVLDALLKWPLAEALSEKGGGRVDFPTEHRIKLVIPGRESTPPGPYRVMRIPDCRDWIAGVHAGESELYVFSLPSSEFPAGDGARQ